MGAFTNIMAAAAVLSMGTLASCSTTATSSASRADLSADSSQALNKLVRENPAAAAISAIAGGLGISVNRESRIGIWRRVW